MEIRKPNPVTMGAGSQMARANRTPLSKIATTNYLWRSPLILLLILTVALLLEPYHKKYVQCRQYGYDELQNLLLLRIYR
ncbi:MAG TPA: hypothetical protein VFO76_10175, partial [Candidatus Kapabacteria bacterium]|nr:hypothetical protein [Candidatus Kapabacteria bacterium]